MAVTKKQAFVLENLDRIVLRKGMRKSYYMLDGQDCRMQITSLAVQKLVTWDGNGVPLRNAEMKGSDMLLSGSSPTLVLAAR